MGITCNDEGRDRVKKTQAKKSNTNNNTPEYPSSQEIRTTHSSIYEEKEKEKAYKKENNKINEQNQKLEEEKKKLEEQKKEFQNQQRLERLRREIEEKKHKIEEDKRFFEMKKNLEEERKKIEKEKQEIENEKKKRQMKEREKLEKKRIEEEKRKLEEEKRKWEEDKKIEEQKRLEDQELKKRNDLENFYDLIIHFHSFEQLKSDGWDASFTKEGKRKYDECINKNNIVIGIIGNKNRGKSYLLGRIMKMNDDSLYPNGFLVTTLGISCIFPTIANKNFVTLDTAGRDNPLLQNAFFTETNKNELIKNIARDQKVTEIALNDFIIQESNVLITVVEQLSFAEQDMLKNLINQIKECQNKIAQNSNHKNSSPKRLIVIHNLMNISKIEDINEFINTTLMRSLTFSLNKQNMSNDGFNDRYVYPQANSEDIQIVHVVIGDDKNDIIRKEFNDPAFDYIRKNITTSEAKKFDIVESFKEFIIENSKNYIEGDKFKSDSLIKGKLSEKDNKIIIPIIPKEKIDKLNLRRVYVNAKGIQNFSSAIEPIYSINLIEINTKDYIEIEMEMYGKVVDMKIEKIFCPNQYIISIKGKNNKVLDDDDEDNKIIMQGNLEFNEFELQVIINRYMPYQAQENNEQNINKKANDEIEIILLKEKYEIEEDTKYGIYKIKIPYKKNIINSSDDENDNDEE